MNKIKHTLGFFVKHLWRGVLFLWQTDKRLTAGYFALQVVMAFLPIASLYFIKKLIELLTIGNHPFRDIIPAVCFFSLTQLFLAITGQLSDYINTIYQQKLSTNLSEKVLEKAIAVDYEYYENPAYHDTLHLAQLQSVYKMPQLLNGITAIFLNLFTLIGIIIFFFTIRSSFALLFTVFSLPLTMIKSYYSLQLYYLERKFAPMEREANYLHRIVTDVAFAKEVRVFGFGRMFIDKFKAIMHNIHAQKKDVHFKLMMYSLIAEGIEVISMGIIFGFLAHQTWQKILTIGAFVIYIQGFQRLQSSSRNFIQAIVQVSQLRHFLRDMFAFFDIPEKHPLQRHFPLVTIGKGLSVNNLSFIYPRTDRQVLFDVSLKCEPGKIIAIVGENGSGKSTLVKLLANLYPLQNGSIKINDSNVDELNLEDFRKNSLFVFQDFEKYFFSVKENIALGEDPTGQEEKIKRAALLSDSASFIEKLPNGYNTRMGTIFQGSAQLSGGQWQKLVLSRIFYKDAKLVILDEPTSALDASAEEKLFVNIKADLKDKMILLVSHRLYNLKIADYIYVMKEGRIIQKGTFNELITDGEFKRLYDAQKI